MEIKWLKIEDVKPYANNAKLHDKTQIANVAESIKQFGWQQPIVVDSDGVIIVGHCRYEAAKKLKLKEVPCVVADNLTEEQVQKYRLLDNKTNESDWDMELLADDLFGLDFDGFDIDWGLDDEQQETEIVEDEAPEVDEENEPIAKLGDIWQLGRHRLMCGDSTDSEQVERLMDGKKADMVFTDPPYGMMKEADGVLNDNLNYDDLIEFNKKWIPLSFEMLKDNGSWYCWGIDEPLMDIYSHILKPMIKRNEITFRNLITWDKRYGQGQLTEGFRMYPIADEKCLFVMCGTMTTTSNECKGFENGLSTWFEGFEKFRAYFDEQVKKMGLTQSDIKKITNTYANHYFSKSQYAFPTKEHYSVIQSYCKKNGIEAFQWDYEEMRAEYLEQRNGKEYTAVLAKQAEKRKEWYETRAYFDNTHDNMNNVWHFDRTSASERELTGGHTTPKPIALCSRAIKSSSREGEIVLDVFGGSGSTLIACEQTGRICYMCELSEKYCDVIIKRWETLTGEKAVLVGE